MGTLTSFLGAAISFQSTYIFQLPIISPFFVVSFTFHKELDFLVGVWAAPVVLANNESWIRHVIFQNPGLAAFLVVDLMILLAATTLTISQASQVI